MPSISFDKEKDSVPIATVKGGDFDKEILYLNSGDNAPKKVIKKELNVTQYNKDLKEMGLKPKERNQLFTKLEQAYHKNIPSEMLIENDNVKSLYSRIQKNEDNNKTVVLPTDSSFQLLPSNNPKTRQVFYIAGASGSGKSYIAKGIAENYKKFFPNREIYLISKLEHDDTLDNMKIGKPKRLNVQSLVDDYPDINEFKECLLIVDDYDTFEPKVLKVVQRLIDDICIQGRHTVTSLVTISHHISNYKATRLQINESSHFVLYPQSTSFHALKYLLSTHLGLAKEDVQEMKKMGRWVCIAKNYPQYLISEHTAKILHQDN
jgi:hypothetical protein